MPFPDSHADFLNLVASMREHGVLSAFGVVLGPPPTKADAATAKLDRLEREGATQELAEERLRVRREQAREHLRLELGASGRTYSDEQLDDMIGPVA